MTFKYPARAAQVTATTGTGTVTLSGSAGEKRSFQEVFGSSAVVHYCIAGSGYYEFGVGTYTSSGATLTRATVYASSNAGSKVDLPGASADVFAWFPGEPWMFESFSADFTLALPSAGNMQCFTGSVVRTVTLPAWSAVPEGTKWPFANQGTARFSFARAGSDTIETGTSFIVLPGESGFLWRDGSQWRVMLTPCLGYGSIASATTTDLSTTAAGVLHVTGVTTITALGTSRAGTRRVTIFDSALQLTHNATSLILPEGVNIAVKAGDAAEWVCEGSGNWRCIDFTRAVSKFKSTDQTITNNGVVTIAHGLATADLLLQFYWVCQSTDKGYSAGAVIAFNPIVGDADSLGNAVLGVEVDATNITIKYPINDFIPQLSDRGGGGPYQVGGDNTKWKLRVLARP